jgi:hypothetical protein
MDNWYVKAECSHPVESLADIHELIVLDRSTGLEKVFTPTLIRKNHRQIQIIKEKKDLEKMS